MSEKNQRVKVALRIRPMLHNEILKGFIFLNKEAKYV